MASGAPCSGVYNGAPAHTPPRFRRRSGASERDASVFVSVDEARQGDQRHPRRPHKGGSMARLWLSSLGALISILAAPAFNRPTAALTAAEAIDSATAYAKVGVIMGWRAANNPPGPPRGPETY